MNTFPSDPSAVAPFFRELSYLRGGSPAADAAIDLHDRALDALTEARNGLAALESPARRRQAETADRDAVIAAAADRTPIPGPVNVQTLDAEIAANRMLVDARVEAAAARREEALEAVAADVPDRLARFDGYTAQILARAERAARELAEIADEAAAAASLRLVLEAVADDVDLITDSTAPGAGVQARNLWRRVTSPTRYEAKPPASSDPAAVLGYVLDRARFMAAVAAGADPVAPGTSTLDEQYPVPSTSWAQSTFVSGPTYNSDGPGSTVER